LGVQLPSIRVLSGGKEPPLECNQLIFLLNLSDVSLCLLTMLPVYITNQVIADPGGGMFITDPKKPAGGHMSAHAATGKVTSGGIMDAKD